MTVRRQQAVHPTSIRPVQLRLRQAAVQPVKGGLPRCGRQSQNPPSSGHRVPALLPSRPTPPAVVRRAAPSDKSISHRITGNYRRRPVAGNSGSALTALAAHPAPDGKPPFTHRLTAWALTPKTRPTLRPATNLPPDTSPPPVPGRRRWGDGKRRPGCSSAGSRRSDRLGGLC